VDALAQPDERTYAIFCHLSLLAAQIIPIVPALVLWLIKRNDSPFIDDHGREALNFQISITIYMIGAGILVIPTLGLSILLVIGVSIFALVVMIIASIAASRGEYYRYPMCMRFVK